MKIFVINLIQSKDRRENVAQQFKKTDLEPDFFAAIDGRALTQEELKSLVVDTNYLSRGEIGCATSHLNIYRKMIESELSFALIFEDDITFSEKFTEEAIDKIANYIDNIPADKPTVILLDDSSFAEKAVHYIDNDIIIRKPVNAFLTHAYFINLQAAKNILKIQTPLKFEIDAWKYYIYLNQLELYCVSPTLVYQSYQFGSIISELKDRDFASDDRAKYKKYNFNQLFRALPLSLKIKTYLYRLNKALLDFKKQLKL